MKEMVFFDQLKSEFLKLCFILLVADQQIPTYHSKGRWTSERTSFPNSLHRSKEYGVFPLKTPRRPASGALLWEDTDYDISGPTELTPYLTRLCLHGENISPLNRSMIAQLFSHAVIPPAAINLKEEVPSCGGSWSRWRSLFDIFFARG